MTTKKTTKKAATKAPKTEDKDVQKDSKDSSEILETLRSIKTKFGDDSIMTLDESKKVDIEAIPSGSIGLDDALGIAGYPRGRIVEIY